MRRIFCSLPCLALLGAALVAHEPPPPAPAVDGSNAAPPLPLPAGWSESSPATAPGAFAAHLAVAGNRLLATWLEPLPTGHRVRFSAHGDGGWSAPSTVRESPALFANWADTPGAVAASDGTLYAWWLEKSAAATYAYDVRLALSLDRGATFRELGILHDDRSPVEHGFVSAVAEGASVRFFYLDGRATGGGGAMQLRSALVTGERIGASEPIDEAVCDCCPTSAIATRRGAAVLFRDRSPGEIRDIRFAMRDSAGALRTAAVGDDRWKIDGCPVNGPALAAGARDPDRLAAAWYAAPADRSRVSFALSRDGGLTFTAPVRVDEARPIGRVALAATARGFVLTWLARVEGGAELRLLPFDDAGGKGATTTLARTQAGRVSGIPRLAVAGDRLWTAWSEPAPRGLRFAWTPAD